MRWGDLDSLSDRVALGLLKQGLKKDDVLVSQLPNNVENIVIRMALLKAGILGIFPPMTLRAELKEIILKFKPTAFVGILDDRFDTLKYVLDLQRETRILKSLFYFGAVDIPSALPIARVIEDIGEDHKISSENLELLENSKCGAFEVAFLGLTSGSTGVPKACEWPTPSVKLFAQTAIERMRLTNKDVMGIIAPLSGGPGITLWLTAILLGAKTALLEKFDPESALSLIEKEKITAVGLVPAQLIKMANHPKCTSYDLSSLRVCRATASLIARQVAREIENKIGCRILTAAGSQESMTIGHTDIDDPDQIRIETVGKPWKYNSVKIINSQGREMPIGEDGEIWVSGPCTGSGYFREREATKESWGTFGIEGWYRTGDIGKVDKQGNIAITGRVKNMISRGGQNIFPEEIERVLLMHPKVVEAVITPFPDPEVGEKACAFLALKDEKDLFSLEEMRVFLESKKIAKFKFPEKLVLMQQFPTVGGGAKIDRNALIRMARQNV
jgi:non-ribosomal peptide synthetase component E (peptide arylation enzyme)